MPLMQLVQTVLEEQEMQLAPQVVEQVTLDRYEVTAAHFVVASRTVRTLLGLQILQTEVEAVVGAGRLRRSE